MPKPKETPKQEFDRLKDSDDGQIDREDFVQDRLAKELKGGETTAAVKARKEEFEAQFDKYNKMGEGLSQNEFLSMLKAQDPKFRRTPAPKAERPPVDPTTFTVDPAPVKGSYTQQRTQERRDWTKYFKMTEAANQMPAGPEKDALWAKAHAMADTISKKYAGIKDAEVILDQDLAVRPQVASFRTPDGKVDQEAVADQRERLESARKGLAKLPPGSARAAVERRLALVERQWTAVESQLTG